METNCMDIEFLRYLDIKKPPQKGVVSLNL
jgi:hypothetical protein